MPNKAVPSKPPHKHAHGVAPLSAAMVGLLLLVTVVAGIAVLRIDVWGESDNGLSDRFTFDIEQYKTVDPALVHYEQVQVFSTLLEDSRAIAIDGNDHILVAGDQAVQVFDAEGNPTDVIAIKGEPTCLAVASAEHATPGRIYVGVGDRIDSCDGADQSAGVWAGPFGNNALLTSLAVGEEEIFAADAGGRIVHRIAADGETINEIGRPDPQRQILGFVVPSPYFDVAISREGLIRVSNPGARRIETYTPEGDLLGQWGKASVEIDGFFGCCNPSNFCLLPDGRFVTAEKGLPRIKVYSGRGELESVVAGTKTLEAEVVGDEIRADHQTKVFDVAADSAGRVIVLDPSKNLVRVFEKKHAT